MEGRGEVGRAGQSGGDLAHSEPPVRHVDSAPKHNAFDALMLQPALGAGFFLFCVFAFIFIFIFWF